MPESTELPEILISTSTETSKSAETTIDSILMSQTEKELLITTTEPGQKKTSLTEQTTIKVPSSTQHIDSTTVTDQKTIFTDASESSSTKTTVSGEVTTLSDQLVKETKVPPKDASIASLITTEFDYSSTTETSRSNKTMSSDIITKIETTSTPMMDDISTTQRTADTSAKSEDLELGITETSKISQTTTQSITTSSQTVFNGSEIISQKDLKEVSTTSSEMETMNQTTVLKSTSDSSTQESIASDSIDVISTTSEELVTKIPTKAEQITTTEKLKEMSTEMPSTLSVKVTTDQTMETNVSEVMTSQPSTILIQDTTEASSERISTEKFIQTTKPQQKEITETTSTQISHSTESDQTSETIISTTASDIELRKLTSSPIITSTIGKDSEEKTTKESVAIVIGSSTMVTDSVKMSTVSTPNATESKSEVEDTSSTVESLAEILISTSTETSKTKETAIDSISMSQTEKELLGTTIEPGQKKTSLPEQTTSKFPSSTEHIDSANVTDQMASFTNASDASTNTTVSGEEVTTQSEQLVKETKVPPKDEPMASIITTVFDYSSTTETSKSDKTMSSDVINEIKRTSTPLIDVITTTERTIDATLKSVDLKLGFTVTPEIPQTTTQSIRTSSRTDFNISETSTQRDLKELSTMSSEMTESTELKSTSESSTQRIGCKRFG